jgi:hypothetical protein
MSSPTRIYSPLWAIIPLIIIALVAWFHAAAIERAETVSRLFTANLILEPDDDSPSGLAGGRRSHVVPGHNLESYEWIVQAESLLHSGNWREREVDYDNAPNGRTVQSPSAMRWWLATVTPLLAGDATVGSPVARASLKTEPLLHLSLIVIGTALVAWQWGLLPGALVAILLGLGFPVVGGFQAGAPSARGLVTLLAAGAILTFLIGLRRDGPARAGRIWAGVAGVTLGLAIWVAPGQGYPLAVALTIGGLIAAWLGRDAATAEKAVPFPWLVWGISGAATTLGCYAIDYLGADITWADGRLHQVHPLYALSVFGLGWLASLIARGDWRRRTVIQAVAATILALSLVGTMLVQRDSGFMNKGLGADLMTHLPNATSAASFAVWVNAQSTGATAAGIFLPLVLIALAVWQLLQRKRTGKTRGTLAAAVVVTLIAAALGLSNLAWWGIVFGGLGAIAALAATGLATPRSQAIFAGLVLIAVGLGWQDLAPRIGEAAKPKLSAADVRSLAERDLAHWLSLRREEFRSVVLSPPDTTPALYFFGGVRGLGTPYAENSEGFIAAVRIASASSPDESLALATQRELSHVVMPSWDSFLYEYAQLGAAQPEHSMVAMLDTWLAPRWMRPVQHILPAVDAFADHSSIIFEVTETQDNASALSRLGEYFAETGRKEFAAAIAVTLQDSFPSDLSGLVAQAQIAVTQGNLPVFNEALAAIIPYVEEERDGDLEFDRRVSLANVLMLGREAEYAREQVGYCMDEMDAFLLKTVSAQNLYRFILLAESFHEPFPDAELAQFARQLLPTQLRSKL